MVEDQAVGRVLRLGQTRKVKVIRYIMKNTVEEVLRVSLKLHLNILTQIRLCDLSR